MRFLLVVFGLAIVGCGSDVADDFYCGPGPSACTSDYDAGFDASLADVHVSEAAVDANDGCGGLCRAGQICSYNPGCAMPSKSCHTDTGGDAVALTYCACDGHEFTTSELFPTQSYANAGHCTTDGGNDASDANDASDDGG
jgi:hypothetical protein